MRHEIKIGFCSLALIASAAHAAPEARNPFHCSIALQVAYEMTREAEGPDSDLSRELHGRLVWQAFAAASFPRALDSDAQGEALRRELTDDSDAGVALAEACIKRQDANPRFQASRVEEQIRRGPEARPLDAPRTIAELKDFHRRLKTAPAAVQP